MFKRKRIAVDSAELHVLRENACEGPLILHVQVDGRDVISLETGHEGAAWLAPGEHHLHVRAWSGAVSSWEPFEKDFLSEPSAHQDFAIRCTRGRWFQKNRIGVFERTWCDRLRAPQAVAGPKNGIDWTEYSFEVIEHGLEEEPAGETSYIEDNLHSSISSTRTITVENEWTRTLIFGRDQTHTQGISATIGVSVLSLEARLETAVTSHYSIQQGERQTFSQEVQERIPAHTRLKVIVDWKYVWQNGVVRISGQDKTIDVPFRLVQSLGFDRRSLTE
jgi:hypothetical protein